MHDGDGSAAAGLGGGMMMDTGGSVVKERTRIYQRADEAYVLDFGVCFLSIFAVFFVFVFVFVLF